MKTPSAPDSGLRLDAGSHPAPAREKWSARPIDPSQLPFGSDFFRELFDNLYDGVYFVDTERRILFWNRGAERLSGYRAREVLGSYCYADILQHTDREGARLCQVRCPLVCSMSSDQPVSERIFLRHKDGRRIAVDVHVMPVHDAEGKVVGGVEVFRDATSRVALEASYARLKELAEKDPLTGVANRRCLDRMLQHQVDLFHTTGVPFSLVMADIDRFKEVNDRFGHAAGDRALIHFAQQLKENTRDMDLVGRFGGEEFLVLLPEHSARRAAKVAERLRGQVESRPPEGLQGRRLTASFGVAEVRLHDSLITLLERSDRALYRAKRSGRNRVEIEP